MKATKGKFFARGVHIRDEKALSADAAIERLANVAEVAIPLRQHIGKPAVPAIEVGAVSSSAKRTDLSAPTFTRAWRALSKRWKRDRTARAVRAFTW